MANSELKIIMVDGLVGNDYSTCLALGLSLAGVKISLVVPENRKVNLINNDIEVLDWSPTKDKAISRRKKLIKYFKYLFRLLILIYKSEHKLVHFQFFRRKEDIIFLLFLKFTGVKIVYTAHNVQPHEKTSLDYFLYKLVYVIVNEIIVHSEYIKNKLIRTFNLSPEKVSVIHHGNFDIYLPPVDISKSQARSKLNLSNSDDVILFFGFIREYKGLDLLLNSFPIALKRNSNLKLVIAGSPANIELKLKYMKLIQSLNCNERIKQEFTFIPSENISNYFIASDLVVLPYRNIDHSGIIHLSYSFARPILATNVGDFSEIIEENKSGFLVEKDDHEKLANAISYAFLDKEYLLKMGLYAKEINTKKYSWKEIGNKTADLYIRITKK